MDYYRIDVLKSVDREARKIDKKNLDRIVSKIKSLTKNPFPVQTKKLKGSESSYRLRVGDYRIIYEVDTQYKLVTIFHIRHRKEAY